MDRHRLSPRLIVWSTLIGLLLGAGTDLRGDELRELQVSLPPLEKWTAQFADVQAAGEAAELVVPTNYKVGRAVSPEVPADGKELLTFMAHVKTAYAGKQESFYRVWLEIESLRGKKVTQTVASPELLGSQGDQQFLAVTSALPAGTTAVRVAVCAQNKYWSVLDNRAVISNLRLVRLGGKSGNNVRLETDSPLPNRRGTRSASLVLSSNWPEGTAVAVSTTRGTSVRSVLLASGGQAQIPLHYAPDEVGSATVTARVGTQEATLRLPDPQAATLSIESILADGRETPALVQLTQGGVPLPGRYQASVPGIFMTAPWTVDLAPGQWKLRVTRGPQFEAIERELDVDSGEVLRLDRLELTRRIDLPSRGWYGGDADGDVYHGELIYTDVNAQTAAEIAQAMGLDWAGVGRWGTAGFGGPNPRTWGEAQAVMRELSHPNFLFLWTDEKPKSSEGHACFIGLERPDGDRFEWRWTGSAGRPLRNFEYLQLIRSSGGATFVNHPLRWWVSGGRFSTNMYSSLPFDLCAADLLDGFNINEREQDLQVWSMLLDHGYQVAATAGADFCLDRPVGPPPGKARMYCYCPDGLSGPALAEAVRRQQTVVSTGPVLLADLAGQPPGASVATNKTYPIRAQAWARGDQPDAVQRLELWAHGKVIAARTFDAGTEQAEAVFEWQPQGEWDWVAVRAVARSGWAMTSAFYAASPNWSAPTAVKCRLSLDVEGLNEQAMAGATIEIWDNPPALVTSRKLRELPLSQDPVLEVPVSATIVVRAGDRRQKEISVYDATHVSELIEPIVAGTHREQPLLTWKTYEEVLQRCRQATVRVAF